jgi:hypothetical protein
MYCKSEQEMHEVNAPFGIGPLQGLSHFISEIKKRMLIPFVSNQIQTMIGSMAP